MVRRKEPEEGPETLLSIARRARVLARALSEPDRSRILAYVQKLETEVARLTAADSQPKARSQKGRRLVERSVRSPKAAGPKVFRP